jgi:hypothetical protein
MNITKQRLKQIIKEELETILSKDKLDEQTIFDNRAQVENILMQIKGMDQKRARKIINSIPEVPMSQLGSYLRMYLSQPERRQIDDFLYPKRN